MALWEYTWAGSGVTKLLYHMNWNANDDSGNAANGTATSVTWTDGILWSWSWSFNWTSSFISTTFSIPTSYTISAYYNSSLSQDWVVIWKDAVWWRSLLIDITSTWRYYIALWNASWTSYTIYPTTAYASANTWANFVLTWGSWNAKLYHNWLLIDTATVSWNAQNTANVLNIWRRAYAWSNIRFPWKIDEVIIENVVRTDAQIQRYYTYSKWRFAN